MAKSKYQTELDITIDVLCRQVKDHLQVLNGFVEAGRENNPLYVIEKLAMVIASFNEINRK